MEVILGSILQSLNRTIIAGIILFSGSLYLISIFKTTSMGIVTPIGGTLFIIGWSVLLFRLSNF